MVCLWYIHKICYASTICIGLTDIWDSIFSQQHIISYYGYRIPVSQAKLKFQSRNNVQSCS